MSNVTTFRDNAKVKILIFLKFCCKLNFDMIVELL
jgi:hypothetical protein